MPPVWGPCWKRYQMMTNDDQLVKVGKNQKTLIQEPAWKCIVCLYLALAPSSGGFFNLEKFTCSKFVFFESNLNLFLLGAAGKFFNIIFIIIILLNQPDGSNSPINIQNLEKYAVSRSSLGILLRNCHNYYN